MKLRGLRPEKGGKNMSTERKRKKVQESGEEKRGRE